MDVTVKYELMVFRNT